MLNSWHAWTGTFTGVVALTVLALPLAALVVWVLARHRKFTGATPAWAWRTALADVGIVYGTVPWLWMMLMPGSRPGEVPGRLSLVPLQDLFDLLAHRDFGQIGGNMLPFAALGFFIPLRFPVLASVPRVLAFAAGCSVLVETAQYVLQLDRVSSVDDVLINAAGAGLAALASRHWWRTTASSSTDHFLPALVPARSGSR